MIRTFYQHVSFLRLLVWLLPFMVPAVLYAQVKPDVTGIVLDPQGEKIPGVTVRAIQTNGGKPVFQMTDDKGWFHFDNLGVLPGPEYRKIAVATGHE